MKLRTLSSTMVSTLLLISAPAALALPFHHPGTAMMHVVKVPMVKFLLRNDSTQTMALRVGEQILQLKPGQSQELKLPVGQEVTAANDTSHFQTGMLVARVSDTLEGNTLVLN